jgi:hypothetical protein
MDESNFTIDKYRGGSRDYSVPSYSLNSAGISKQFIGARNQVGIGLSILPARLHSLAKLVP